MISNGMPKSKQNRKESVLSWILWGLVPCIVVLLLNAYVFRLAHVAGDSMLPTFHNKDLVIVLVTKNVKPGDVIVIDENGQKIKRLIAVGGQRVLVDYSSDAVVIDGVALDEGYRKNEPMAGTENTEYTVPEGCFFVLGDNRNHSIDSRYYGCVNPENVVGKVILSIPLGKWIEGVEFDD